MKKIAIASVLKPANEVRISERFGQSLLNIDSLEVHLIGESFQSNAPIPHLLRNHTFSKQKNRAGRHFSILRDLVKIQPDIIIITAPELTPVAWLCKIMFRSKVIFDVQEDYLNNIKHQGIYRGIKMKLALLALNFLLQIGYKITDHFILAEKCYSKLKFALFPHTVLENKYADVYNLKDQPSTANSTNTLLFSGTISHYSGILHCLNFFDKLRSENNNWILKVIGKCYDPGLKEFLKIRAANDPSMKLFGLDEFVDHGEIVSNIHTANVGLICHEYNQVSSDRVPTKLYEYAYLELPIITWENTNWSNVGNQIGNCAGIDFNSLEHLSLHQILSNLQKQPLKSDKTKSGWASIEAEFLMVIKALLKKK